MPLINGPSEFTEARWWTPQGSPGRQQIARPALPEVRRENHQLTVYTSGRRSSRI
jgi:hypothetical protein